MTQWCYSVPLDNSVNSPIDPDIHQHIPPSPFSSVLSAPRRHMSGRAQPNRVDGEFFVGLVEDLGGGRDGDDVGLEDKVTDAPTGRDVVPKPLEEGVLRGH